ncbi:MAG TPA: STAS domain-containing protein [Paucimonas sp.]|nr:STAS domain-containing protein [Paucimonas sp.]HJW57241.1 STAS domain-containing protein [Burkholderiaceae bacterium]
MFQPTLALTVDNARKTLEDGLCAIQSGQTEINLAQLTEIDSSAVAALLAWQRAARERQQALTFTNLPPNLQSLVQLYDVAELLRLAPRSEASAGAQN